MPAVEHDRFYKRDSLGTEDDDAWADHLIAESLVRDGQPFVGARRKGDDVDPTHPWAREGARPQDDPIAP